MKIVQETKQNVINIEKGFFVCKYTSKNKN